MVKKEKKQPLLTLDGKEYFKEDLDDRQMLMVNHLFDLEKKTASMKFNLEQMEVGKNAFLQQLKASLNEKPEEK
tara:strand:- start:581 stop:802 length:222 start_codon:yes stop_codon:yes gene_type:complete